MHTAAASPAQPILAHSPRTIIPSGLQASLRARAAGAYASRWAAAIAARGRTGAAPNATTTTSWWTALEGDLGPAGSDQLRLEPLRHNRCSTPHSCVGLSRAGGCVCYSSSSLNKSS